MVCGSKLDYRANPKPLICYFCGETKHGSISCANGHFVCDACHGKDAFSAVVEVALNTKLSDPMEIADQIMSHPSVPMIGGEHHAIVATSIMAALKNSDPIFYNGEQIKVDNNFIRRTIDRTWTNKLPSCMCANYGACGAALAAGAVFSLLTNATCDVPKARERQISMEITNYAASDIAWYRGTCCKLSVKLAIDGTCLAIKEHFDLNLPRKRSKCQHMKRNPYKCLGTQCPYSKA